jgi:hypothetical protein
MSRRPPLARGLLRLSRRYAPITGVTTACAVTVHSIGMEKRALPGLYTSITLVCYSHPMIRSHRRQLPVRLSQKPPGTHAIQPTRHKGAQL